MRKLKMNCSLCAFLATLFMSTNAYPFFGMMRKMMGGGGMGPSQMLMQMCGSSMGNMAAGMMNGASNMASMVPIMGGMFNGMKQGMTSQMMSEVLKDPKLTLQALHCAKQNNQVVHMMLETMSKNRRLLHRMGNEMVRNPWVAHSMIELALMKPQVGRFLLHRIDGTLFHMMTYALVYHPSLAQGIVELVWLHRQEVLRKNSPLLRVFTRWGEVENDGDGVEMAVERFVYAIFSDVKAANLFMRCLDEADREVEEYLLDIIFLGKIEKHYYDYQKREWQDSRYDDQSYYNLYAVFYGLRNSLVTEEMKEDPDLSKATKDAAGLMGHMMRYMVDYETKRPTRWGIRLMRALMAGAHMHQDKNIGEFASFLVGIMPGKFEKSMERMSQSKSMEMREPPAPRAFY